MGGSGVVSCGPAGYVKGFGAALFCPQLCDCFLLSSALRLDSAMKFLDLSHISPSYGSLAGLLRFARMGGRLLLRQDIPAVDRRDLQGCGPPKPRFGTHAHALQSYHIITSSEMLKKSPRCVRMTLA